MITKENCVRLSSNKITLNGHTNGVHSVVVSPDGKLLASGSYDNTVKLWEIESRKEIASLTGHTSHVYSVAFSPDGKLLASGSHDYKVKLWDVVKKSEISTLNGHTY